MIDPLPLVLANHKANKSWSEVKSWLDEVGPVTKNFQGTVVFCPSTPFLAASYAEIKNKGYKMKLGAQDISFFEQGPYTGEMAASQIKDIASYVIIGHSERRQNFQEDDAHLQNKLVNAQHAGLNAVFCVQSDTTPVLNDVPIIAYEPTFAIGTGNADTLDHIQEITQKIKQKGPYTVLYGGSVSKDNVGAIRLLGSVDGVLVGASHSLDTQKFIDILNEIK